MNWNWQSGDTSRADHVAYAMRYCRLRLRQRVRYDVVVMRRAREPLSALAHSRQLVSSLSIYFSLVLCLHLIGRQHSLTK